MRYEMKAMRDCEVCKSDCKGKKVWEKHGKKVICMNCGYVEFSFWIDGSVYSRKNGPTDEQKSQIAKE